jgi:hypothetical protein
LADIRDVEQDDMPRSSNNNKNQSNPSETSPSYSWFHPSHPLREDPRITARRYNNGYDLDSEPEHRGDPSSSAASWNGEKEAVNYERVIFAEQVLKPM